MDRSVRPQDDLFGFVNGGWIQRTQIPEDRGRFGSFDELREAAQAHVRTLLDEAGEAVATGQEQPDGLRGKVGALFASFMDQERVETLGLSPIAADLDAAQDCSTVEELWRLLGRLQREGVSGAVAPFVSTDNRDSERYTVYLEQDGLGLPDEAYYREDQHAGLREEYVAHLRRMGELSGAADPAGDAELVMALETRLAASHWDRVATRDAIATYTKMTFTELTELAPNVPWQVWFEALGAPREHVQELVVRQPSFLTGLSEALQQEPLRAWQAWLRRRILGAFAPYLNEAFTAESFDFYGRALSGTPKNRERWKRATDLVDSLMGEAAGQLYVERHFPPQAKERMLTLVDNVVEAYRRDITTLAWMSEETKAKALEKLSAFTPKIAYPDTWRDYSGLHVDPVDLVGNVRRGSAFEADRDWAKLGGPIQRGEWLMTPQTVNAYYNPGMNEIVFPAAILQPPFFDVEADDAVNYGAIGAVIGHEIGHGFDDQGSRYDGAGNLVEWWTQNDRDAFDALAAKLIAQYDAFSPRELPEEHVNGSLTVGENIGDLGGVTIAHLAYRISLGSGGLDSAPVIDGMTGEQRFFAGWAQVWRMKARTEETKRLLNIDPHSPGEFRANIVRNLTEFHRAFEVAPGDGLWLDEEERVRIW
ncbi:M13 family metallopeptidase [Gephyromycinifex aptenodytis]|uniref:M13 family metallopeptidase n=1 Tax=Gephyromycinifex aptenodytis TaxID=2716227 RepID=UPI001446C7A2|nr:M13-type metalloendopeptidase [Gephyromycinifex aptenodytis]